MGTGRRSVAAQHCWALPRSRWPPAAGLHRTTSLSPRRRPPRYRRRPILSLQPPKEILHGPRNRAEVALTFHGQGDERVVGQLLAELANGGAHVAVLAVGTWLQQVPTMARRILDGGHELGNHTQHHLDLKTMPADKAYAEIAACATELKRLTGSIGTTAVPVT